MGDTFGTLLLEVRFDLIRVPDGAVLADLERLRKRPRFDHSPHGGRAAWQEAWAPLSACELTQAVNAALRH